MPPPILKENDVLLLRSWKTLVEDELTINLRNWSPRVACS